MKIIVISLFIAYIVHGHFGIRDKFKKWLKLGSSKSTADISLPFKPMDCLPCLSFYCAILVSGAFMLIEWQFSLSYIYAALATFVITETIDKYKRE